MMILTLDGGRQLRSGGGCRGKDARRVLHWKKLRARGGRSDTEYRKYQF
jgi:hypothetical protein